MNDQEATDQWDGTDIEPSYAPRKMKAEDSESLGDDYVASYREGDLFS
jgi:hypothetical protein